MIDSVTALMGTSGHLSAGLAFAGLFLLGAQVGKALWVRTRVRQLERLTRHD